MIDSTVIHDLIAIGLSEELEDPHVFDSFARHHNPGKVSGCHWSVWEEATSTLHEDQLIALIKALTLLGNAYSGESSVASSIWVHRIWEMRGHKSELLKDWISTHSNNPWFFGQGSDWRIRKHIDDEHNYLSELTMHEREAARKRIEQAKAEHEAILSDLRSRSPGDRLVIAATNFPYPWYFDPEEWADISDEDLMAIESANRDTLIQWLPIGEKGCWRRLRRRLKRIRGAERAAGRSHRH